MLSVSEAFLTFVVLLHSVLAYAGGNRNWKCQVSVLHSIKQNVYVMY